MKVTNYSLAFLVLALLLMSGCQKKLESMFRDPVVGSVSKVFDTTLPLAYAANLSVQALQGASLPNVHFVTGGDSVLGTFLLEITVDDQFPLPQGVQATGVIMVAGLAARQNVYLMTVVFSHLDIVQGTFAISDVSTIPVIQNVDLMTGDTTLFVVYSDMDVNAGSDTLMTVSMSDGQIQSEFNRYENLKNFDGTDSSVALEQNAWIIQVDNHGTPDNALDDSYHVSGSGQYIGVDGSYSDILQIIMVDNIMKPSCKENPLDGWTMIQNIGANAGSAEIGHLLLNAHSQCDGKMEVTVGTGVYLRATGESVDLNL